MTANKHTPGPWHHEVTNSAHTSYVVVSADGLANGSTVVIGQCAGPDRLENARLIAAAPEYFDGTADLLAYEDAVEAGDDVQAMLLYASAVKKLRAAHLKATGGAA